MAKSLTLIAVAVATMSLGACVQGNAPGAGLSLAAAAPPKEGAKWDMPWQLLPASSASEAQGERTTTRMVEGYGEVRGTEPALTYVSYPLSSLQVPKGRNRAVDPCRSVVEKTSAPLGAVKVEAASGGPEQRSRDGFVAPVAFRIFYKKQTGYEVRQSILTCKLDRKGQIKDAFVPGTKGSYASLKSAD